MMIERAMKFFYDLPMVYSDILYILAMLLGIVLLAFIARKALKKLRLSLAATHNIWDDTIVLALELPVVVFICLCGILLAIQRVLTLHAPDFDASYLLDARRLIVTLVIFWFVWRLIYRIEVKMIIPYSWRKPSDPTTVAIVARLLRIVVIIVTTLVFMQIFGFPVTGLWAFGGGGTIILGIAAQDLLANFFGGLMIFLDRPFSVGDWISSPDRNIEGTVQFIGWRTTKVLTFEKRPLYLPNSIFTKIIIVNPQRMTNRRINATVGIRYDDAAQVRPIVSDIKALLHNHPDIDQQQSIFVNFVSFGASSLDIEIYCFTKTTAWGEWRDIRENVYLSMLDIVANHRAEVAFPTRTVLLSNEQSAGENS